MKAYKWIAVLLLGLTLTACDAGTIKITTSVPAANPTKKTTVVTSNVWTTGPGGCGVNPACVTGDEREKLLLGKTSLADAGMIDRDSLRVIGVSADAAAGVENLFDGTNAEWYCVVPEASTQTINLVWIIFATTEPVTVTAYDMITGSDLIQNPESNPVEWFLYGTNDPAALTAEDPETVEWTVLDYVYDGMMHEENLMPHGVSVDNKLQNKYRYYAWVAGYTCNGEFRLSELDLYIG